MKNRQSLTKLLMFLLPAVLTIAAYTTFYDSLFGSPKCKNCDQLTQNNSQYNGFDLRKILDLIDQLRQNLAAKDAHLKYAQRTPLDLTFLKDKLETFGNKTGVGNDLKSENNQKDDDSMSQEKPLVIAKIDEKNIPDEFEELPPPIITVYPPNPRPDGPYVINPGPRNSADCTIDNTCLPPPPLCTQNMPLSSGCPIVIIPDKPSGNPGGNEGGSTVPLPSSTYLLLSGLLIVFITRFRRFN
jgi:hypothetical protein